MYLILKQIGRTAGIFCFLDVMDMSSWYSTRKFQYRSVYRCMFGEYPINPSKSS